MITQAVLICVLYGQEYHVEAHVIGTYGLCPGCWSRDTLREDDRLESAKRHARAAGNADTLTLAQWLAPVAVFNGKCGLCEVRPFEEIGILDACGGIALDNCFPVCRSCRTHLVHGFDLAIARIQGYLQADNP